MNEYKISYTYCKNSNAYNKDWKKDYKFYKAESKEEALVVFNKDYVDSDLELKDISIEKTGAKE